MTEQRTQVESLCMKCGENGLTQLLPCNIPHFKQVIIASFECTHCGETNNEILSARAIGDYGIEWTLKVSTTKDLSRQVVRTEYASISIPELELEVPSSAFSNAKGLLTTVEGLLGRFIDDLSLNQEERKNGSDPEAAIAIENIIAELEKMKCGERCFSLVLDDPAGNSYIEFLSASTIFDDGAFTLDTPEALDPSLLIRRYVRSSEQNVFLGFNPEPSLADESTTNSHESAENDDPPSEIDSVFEFMGTCPSCLAYCPTRMHPIDIPYFKEVIIMATTCPVCNFKSSEIKTGGAISPLGRRITFSLQCPEDLSRDILKSETCSIFIPEIDLELAPGTLGGRFTTIEGLLVQIKEEMEERIPFALGDSATPKQTVRFQSLVQALSAVLNETKPVTIVIDDPLANSYLQSFFAPDPDPQIQVEDYERTEEQQDSLGLTHLSV
ncbi:nucleolar zinc-finger protein [Mitosporidium daphniae]